MRGDGRHRRLTLGEKVIILMCVVIAAVTQHWIDTSPLVERIKRSPAACKLRRCRYSSKKEEHKHGGEITADEVPVD